MSRRGRRVAMGAGVTIVLAGLLGVLVLRGIRRGCSEQDRQMCTQFISTAFVQHAEDHAGWYPVSELGEYPALSEVCVSDGEDAYSMFFATYGTRGLQQEYFRKHRQISESLCPYRYVQGLREGDPPELIVLYRKSQTRWRTHIDCESQARWLVMRPGALGQFGGDGWVTTPEFTRRLRRTLEFLEKLDRPNRSSTIAVHEVVLKRLEGSE